MLSTRVCIYLVYWSLLLMAIRILAKVTEGVNSKCPLRWYNFQPPLHWSRVPQCTASQTDRHQYHAKKYCVHYNRLKQKQARLNPIMTFKGCSNLWLRVKLKKKQSMWELKVRIITKKAAWYSCRTKPTTYNCTIVVYFQSRSPKLFKVS